MAISTLCPGCQSLFRLPDELAGKHVRCQKCNRLLTVPGVLATAIKAPATKVPPVKAPPSEALSATTPPVAMPPPRPVPVAAPPVARTPSVPPPRVPAAPSTTDGGVPGVVLVEVPVRPVPPPLPEPTEPARAGKPEPPPSRPGPTMTLNGRDRTRRGNNRPRRPASALAGLSLGGMLFLFVILLAVTGTVWVATTVNSQPPRPQVMFNNGQPFGGGFRPIQPVPAQPQFPGFAGNQLPNNGAQNTDEAFHPGPNGPKPDNRNLRTIRLINGQAIVRDQLSANDALDPVLRFAQPHPRVQCKVYLVQVQEGKKYIIDYQRNQVDFDFDPYLRVETEDGDRLVEQDDVQPLNPNNLHDMSSRVEFHPTKTATYRVVCTLFQRPLQGGKAMPFTLTIRERPLVPELRDKFRPPLPGVPNGGFVKETLSERDVRGTVIKRQPFNHETAGDLCWSADGSSFYVLYKTGLLVKVGVNGFEDQRRIELGRAAGKMAMSGQGLVVTVPPLKGANPAMRIPGTSEVWLIDPETLQVKARFGAHLRADDAAAVASAPGLDFAYVAAGGESNTYPATHGILVLDLVNKRPVRFYDLPNAGLAVSPRGDLLFAMDKDALTSFEIHKAIGDLELKRTSHPYGRNANRIRIDVSPDGKLVCVAGPDAPDALRGEKVQRTSIPVYAVDDLRKPKLVLDTDAAARAVGFDPTRTQRFLCQTKKAKLAVFDAKGHLRSDYQLLAIGNDDRENALQYLPSADGAKVLVRFPHALCYLSFKGEMIPGPAVAHNNPAWPMPVRVKDEISVAIDAQKRGGVTYRELQLANLGDIDPCWDAQGKALFHLDTDGTLTRMSANDFTPTDRLFLGKPAAAMALSAEGLLVALREVPEVWVIDPQSLKVLSAITCPSPARFLACHPRQSLAAAVGAEVTLLDLKQGKVAARGLQPHPDAGLPFHQPALTPDGKYLLLAHASGGTAKVLRVRIERDAGRMVVEESKNTAVKGKHAFCVTADSKHIAWYSLTGQGKQPVAFYAIDQWNAPAFSLPMRARAMESAADGSLYVQTTEFNLMQVPPPVQNPAPESLRWDGGRIGVRDLAARPEHAGALVASTGARVFYIERAAK